VLKPDVPGTCQLALVATAQDPGGNLYTQDIRGTVQVQAEGTFGYHASKFGRWLQEAIGTTQIIIGGIAAVVATIGTFLVSGKSRSKGRPTSNRGRHSLRNRRRRPRMPKRGVGRPVRSKPSAEEDLSDSAS
jgi:hypothetical protein